jgi:Na+-translocating ferredoxin:NAD+ oxidoreductase RnfD subunit
MHRSSNLRPSSAIPLSHSGIGVGSFYAMHLLGIILPLAAGLLLYGWRAAIVLAGVLASTLLTVAIWRQIGTRGHQLRYSHAAWLALLLGMMLPAHLATQLPDGKGRIPWLILPAAGVTLAIIMWVVGGLGTGRIHPTVVAFLLIAGLFGDMLTPRYVLRKDHIFTGDILKVSPDDQRTGRADNWFARKYDTPGDAERADPAATALIDYTSGREHPARGWLPIQGLLRDSMPPLEDLIVGGQPGPIGVSSRLTVIVGGLFLLYRGLIDIRIPMVICVVQFLALLVLPIPSVIANHAQWRWFALRDPAVGAATAVTLANYELMASPALFMAFFIATSPSIRPMAHRPRVIFAAMIGLLSALLQLYVSVDFGPYIALLLVCLLTPSLDWFFRPRPSV